MILKTLYGERVYIDRREITKAEKNILKASYKPNDKEEEPKEIPYLYIETRKGDKIPVIETVVTNEKGTFKADKPDLMMVMIESGT